jgi:predicted outer membrane protein
VVAWKVFKQAGMATTFATAPPIALATAIATQTRLRVAAVHVISPRLCRGFFVRWPTDCGSNRMNPQQSRGLSRVSSDAFAYASERGTSFAPPTVSGATLCRPLFLGPNSVEGVQNMSTAFKFGVVAAAISCLLAGFAAAQQLQTADQNQSSQARDASSIEDSGQSDRSSDQQSGRLSTRGSDSASPTGERYTANFRGAPDAGSANKEVEKFLAGCLLQKNQAEIEMSQLAAQQSQNPEVKKFAQQMIKDHQQLVQQLQPLVGMQADANRRSSATGTSIQSERTTSSLELGTGDTDSVRGQTSGSDASSLDATADTSNTGAANDPPRSTSSTGRTSLTDSVVNLTGPGQGSGAIQQLASIEKQIADRHKQAVMDELQEKQGAEFDKCYIGAAVGAHVHMNAALEVIAQQNQGQLSQLAQKAQPKVQQHLDHAKQLMKQLEGESASRDTDRADRPTDRTQR